MKRTLPIIASVVSLVFSFFGLFFVFIFSLALNTKEGQDEMINTWIEQGFTRAEANEMIDILSNFLSVFQVLVYIFLVVGIVLFVLALILKPTNKTWIGIIFIVSAVFHFFTIRFLAFVLLLIAGLKILSYKEELEETNYQPLNQPQY
jgi:Protein of unknown function (DUF4064)